MCIRDSYKGDRQINSEIEAEIMQYVEKLEEMTGKKFGDLYNPLLVSVRSGARQSMPGMMDTILNLGLNDEADVYKRQAQHRQTPVLVLAACALDGAEHEVSGREHRR